MSWAALDWAETAPVASPYEWIILNMMAARADPDGEGAYLSPATIARRSRTDEQTIKTHMKALRSRRVIVEGDQSRAAHIPANRRPKVYDLMIPVSEYTAKKLDEVNRFRAEHGRPPLDATSRPDLEMPEQTRKKRSDVGVSKNTRGDVDADVQPMSFDDGTVASKSASELGGVVDTPGKSAGGSTTSPQGGLQDPAGGVYDTPNSFRATPEENSLGGTTDVTPDRAGASEQPPTPIKFDLDDPTTWSCKGCRAKGVRASSGGAACGPCGDSKRWAGEQLALREQTRERQQADVEASCARHDSAGWVVDPETGLPFAPAVRCTHDAGSDPEVVRQRVAREQSRRSVMPSASESGRAAAMAEIRKSCKASNRQSRASWREPAAVPADKDGLEAAQAGMAQTVAAGALS